MSVCFNALDAKTMKWNCIIFIHLILQRINFDGFSFKDNAKKIHVDITFSQTLYEKNLTKVNNRHIKVSAKHLCVILGKDGSTKFYLGPPHLM